MLKALLRKSFLAEQRKQELDRDQDYVHGLTTRTINGSKSASPNRLVYSNVLCTKQKPFELYFTAAISLSDCAIEGSVSTQLQHQHRGQGGGGALTSAEVFMHPEESK